MMKLFVFLVFVAGAFASEDECPSNQHYNNCGTLCPVTCENYKNPPKACFLMCNPGCECDDGYVKDKDGSCVEPEDCSVPEEKNCVDKPDGGMCRGNFPMWYYDEDARDCKEFVYGGCQGNGNRYGSRTECLKSCASIWESRSDRCDLPAKTGVCKGYFARFYFDKASGQCKKFVYGGCRGNENNFQTEEECESACGNRAAALDGYDCDMAPDSGVCYASFRRYYYDQKDGQCKKFTYGGCHGNKNNFRTEEECYKKCGASHAKSRNACEEDKVVGSCKAAFARFYFNKNTGHCEPFIYGGCDGNSNNFLTLEDCEDVCIY